MPIQNCLKRACCSGCLCEEIVMEIKSIKEIKNIGTFANFTNGGQLRFHKLTFIYGLNTFGKTTLTDIFQSLKENDPEILQSRETIPQQQGDQTVSISVHNGQNENDLKFKNNCWNQNEFNKHLEIFGTNFIHKNLFTGMTVEHENKKNFTQFVLGDAGVLLAKEIAEKKKKLRSKNDELKSKIPEFVKRKPAQEQKKFLNHSIDELNKQDIELTLSEKKLELKTENENLAEPQKILNLNDVNTYTPPKIELIKYIEDVNSTLKKNYRNIKDEVLAKLNSHIQQTFKNSIEAESWIQYGFENLKSKKGDCNFCGQSLKNASSLINAYDSYFDAEYTKFIKQVQSDLATSKANISNEIFNQKSKIQQSLTSALKFKDLIKDEQFQTELENLSNTIKLINEDTLTLNKESILIEISSKQDEKNRKPYVALEEINFNELQENLKIYDGCLNDAQKQISILRTLIIYFKEQYKDIESIRTKVETLTKEIENLEYDKARIDQNQSCLEFCQLEGSIQILKDEISTLQDDLETNQSSFLDDYFVQINKLFKFFGSKNFTLERENSGSGYMPVYSLKVKFHNNDISNSDLNIIFSESDKRALALAIFWAKIELKTVQEKEKTVVVLDDPITSFDDNRIINSIRLFKNALNSLGQLIILTHYPNFIKSFCERAGSLNVKFFKLEKNQESSLLSSQNKNEFTDSQYEKTFSKIYGYIRREHTNCIKTDLRPFLENMFLPTLFANKLKQAKLEGQDVSNLSQKIDYIFDENDDVKNKFHDFRELLNPEAHIVTTANAEDVRCFAEEMFDCLYSFNY